MPKFLMLVLVAIGLSTLCCETQKPSNEQTTSQAGSTYLRGEMPIQHGMQLFNQHCASCHDFSESGIGPNLSGVTSQVDKEWLIKFIHNPPALIDEGDIRAVQLFEKYKQYMPPFPMIHGEDMEDLLSFIHKFSQGEEKSRNNRPGGLLNPIVPKIDTATLTLILEESFQVPLSSDAPPISRINKMNPIPGDRLFLHDLRGKLFEISEDHSIHIYMDLAKLLPHFIDNPGKGTGFGSWAFHPAFEQNGLFYTTHNEPAATKSADFPLPDSITVAMQAVLLEWQVDNPDALAFAGSHRELLRVDMAGGAHTFQEVIFNPLVESGHSDYGNLYLGIGDATLALKGYPFLCDNIEHIWGSVIRIDPAGKNSSNGKYGVPPDNPFIQHPTAVKEIWAYGFRNPHRITWDPTGSEKMLITNIGQHSLEEVNLGKPGANYGWPKREGTFLFDVDANPELVYPLPPDDTNFTYPVIQYDHDEGSAVSGGFVYNGKTIPVLQNKYIFGDISLGMLFYTEISDITQGEQAPIYRLNVSMNGRPSDMATITGCRRVDLRIGIDIQGELYLLSKCNGKVYKVVACTSDAAEMM